MKILSLTNSFLVVILATCANTKDFFKDTGKAFKTAGKELSTAFNWEMNVKNNTPYTIYTTILYTTPQQQYAIGAKTAEYIVTAATLYTPSGAATSAGKAAGTTAAREGAEAVVQTGTREVTEAAVQTAARETTESLAKKGAQEAAESTAQTTAKQPMWEIVYPKKPAVTPTVSAPKIAVAAPKETAEEAAESAAKKTAQETAEALAKKPKPLPKKPAKLPSKAQAPAETVTEKTLAKPQPTKIAKTKPKLPQKAQAEAQFVSQKPAAQAKRVRFAEKLEDVKTFTPDEPLIKAKPAQPAEAVGGTKPMPKPIEPKAKPITQIASPAPKPAQSTGGLEIFEEGQEVAAQKGLSEIGEKLTLADDPFAKSAQEVEELLPGARTSLSTKKPADASKLPSQRLSTTKPRQPLRLRRSAELAEQATTPPVAPPVPETVPAKQLETAAQRTARPQITIPESPQLKPTPQVKPAEKKLSLIEEAMQKRRTSIAGTEGL